MVALALAYAFAIAFAPAPDKALPQALVAAIALAAAATAALDLERGVDTVQRERPAVAAGLMWLAAAGLTVAVCGIQEVLLFRPSASTADAMQLWKWSMVLCFAVGAAASVAGVWLSTRCAAPALLLFAVAPAPHSSARSGAITQCLLPLGHGTTPFSAVFAPNTPMPPIMPSPQWRL